MERNKEQHSQGIPSKEGIVDTSTTPSQVVDVMDNPVPSQPKLYNGKIMEQYGLRVPRIFESLEEGLEWLQNMPAGNGHSIIIRSEHPEEGVINARSGILDSIQIRHVTEIETKTPILYINGAGSIDSAKEAIEFIQGQYLERQIEKATLVGYDKTKVSFSVWEGINGDNYTVVEDKSERGMYFIHAGRDNKVGGATFRRVRYDEAPDTDKKLIDEYKKVQLSGKFGETPIVELQHQFFPIKDEGGELTWEEGEVFFLQALQIHDGVQRSFSLDRPKEKDEHQALFVRGATPPEGVEVTLVVQDEYDNLFREVEVPCQGTLFSSRNLSDGNKQNALETLFSQSGDEVMVMSIDWSTANQRFGRSASKLKYNELASLIYNHVGISFVHKPSISIVVDEKFRVEGNDGIRKMRIISDGQKAYIKILD